MNGKNTYLHKNCRVLIGAAAALLLGVLYGCLLLTFYHADTGYTDGKWTEILCAVSVLLFGFLGVCTAYRHKNESKNAFSESKGTGTVAERAAKIVFAAGFLMIPLFDLLADPSDPLKNPSAAAPLFLFCLKWSVIFAILSGLCLLLDVILQPKDTNVRFLLYFPSSLFTITYVLRRYLDTSVLLADQRRILSILAIAVLSLFIVGEMRLLTGRFSAYYYALTGFLSLATLSLSGIGSLVLNLGKGARDGLQLGFIGFETLAAFFVAARLLHVFGKNGTAADHEEETRK